MELSTRGQKYGRPALELDSREVGRTVCGAIGRAREAYNHAVSPVLSAAIRLRLKQLIAIVMLSAAGVALATYAVDYGVFRYRVSRNQALGQVTVTSYDAVQQKNGKTESLFDPPRAQTCVNSLFPHAAYLPCWYLRRHPEQRTDI